MKSSNLLGRAIWRELLRESKETYSKEQLKEAWERDRTRFVKMARKILRKAEERGHKITIADAD